jgi:hypothetical protein
MKTAVSVIALALVLGTLWEAQAAPSWRARTTCALSDTCTPCLPSVAAAVRSLEGRHTFVFTTAGLGAGVQPDGGSASIQGVARLSHSAGAQWLAYTTTEGLVVVQFPSLPPSPQPWSETSPRWPGWDQGRAVRSVVSDALRPHGHWGGIQAVGRFVAAGSSRAGNAAISFFDTSSPATPRFIYYLDVAQYIGAAHYVGLLQLDDRTYLAFAAQDQHQQLEDKSHQVAFFRSQGRDLPSATSWHYVGLWSRAEQQDYQSASLVAQCDGRIHLIGFGKENMGRTTGKVHVWRLDGVSQGRVQMTKVAEQALRTRRTRCQFNAGASAFVTPTGQLVVYCMPKQDEHLSPGRGTLHVQEFVSNRDF